VLDFPRCRGRGQEKKRSPVGAKKVSDNNIGKKRIYREERKKPKVPGAKRIKKNSGQTW